MDYEKNRRIRKDLIDFLEELSKLGKNTNFDKWSKSDCAEWIAWVKSKHATGKLKECMYAKDHYTDDDRKVLCEGCEEECEYAQKEEPVSEDLEEAAKHYLYSNILYDDVYVGNPTDKDCIEMFKAGANWQKQQMMKDAITGQLENGEDYLRIKCLYTSCRPQDDGKLVKFIIIKED